MTTLSPLELASLHHVLDRRASALRAELGLAAPSAVPAGGEVTDTKELAERREQQLLRDAERQRDATELGGVLDALQRIEHGSYGQCIDCGEAIAVERLFAQPSAARCTACQASEESAPGRAVAA